MRLRSLRLSNFRQHADTHIEFGDGLTGIIGPNGSGKTTILEAVAWALYGTPAARGTKESIRSLRAPPRAVVNVELEFDLGAHRYRVSRGLTSAELFLDDGSTPVANSITGVSDLLRRRLGMSLGEFFNTYFTGQKELSVMASMGPSERAQFLSRVLGYERLRTAQGLARDRRRLIIAEASGLRSGMADADVVTARHAEAVAYLAAADARARESALRSANARALLDGLTPQWQALQREREQLQALNAELRVAEGEESALGRDALRLERAWAEIVVARGQLDQVREAIIPIDGVRRDLAELEQLAREDGRRQTLVESERALGDELARLLERRGRLETAPQFEKESTIELDRRRAELEATEGRLQALRTEWVRDAQEADTKIEQLKAQLQSLRDQREQLVSLGENGTCPTCSRPLGDHYRIVLDLLDEQIETVTVDGRYYRARTQQLENPPPEVAAAEEQRRQIADAVVKLEKRQAKVQLALQELAALEPEVATKEQRRLAMVEELARAQVAYDSERHRALRGELERLALLEAQATRLSALIEREPQLIAEREGSDRQLAIIRDALAALRLRRDALRASDQLFVELRSRYDAATAELRAAELASVAAESDTINARSALEAAERARQELARTQEKLAALGRDKHLHDELDRSYADIRSDLNQQLRPEISELASRFLSELTDGRYTELELDDGYDVTVLEDGIPKPVISGGEEDLTSLVLRLAISQMIAERAGQPLSLLILDEVFGSLDEARRHNVVDLLRRLQDRFEQVILITHIESVREGLDRIITVRYDEESGTSRVEDESLLLEEALEDPRANVREGAAD